MSKQHELSNVAKDYLKEYKFILNKMIKNMTNIKLNDSISNNFICQMIPHHQAAIEMSKNILRYTTNIPLQNIALNIISNQTKIIDYMIDIKMKCNIFCNSNEDLYNYKNKFDKISRIMFRNMNNSSAINNINVNFINEMIPHHIGTIRMSNNALKYHICPDLKVILNTMAVSQTKKIEKMRAILRYII